MTAILAFLKLVPVKAYAILALVLLFATYGAWEKHVGSVKATAAAQVQIAAIQAQFDAALQANNANDAAIKTLQQSLAECEKNRLAEVAQTAEVKATYAKQIELFKQTDAKAHAATAQRLASTCKDIARMPTCVTATP